MHKWLLEENSPKTLVMGVLVLSDGWLVLVAVVVS